MTTTPTLLTVAEFAATVRLHANKIRQKIRAGEITAVDVGPKKDGTSKRPVWRISETELHRFLAENTNTRGAA